MFSELKKVSVIGLLPQFSIRDTIADVYSHLGEYGDFEKDE